MLVRLSVLQRWAEAFANEVEPVLELLLQGRGVEDDEADLLPVITSVLATDDADRPLERLAAEPEFAIERDCRQTREEPLRGVVQVPLTRDELLAIPVGADSVELLAHEPSGRIGDTVPRLG